MNLLVTSPYTENNRITQRERERERERDREKEKKDKLCNQIVHSNHLSKNHLIGLCMLAI